MGTSGNMDRVSTVSDRFYTLQLVFQTGLGRLLGGFEHSLLMFWTIVIQCSGGFEHMLLVFLDNVWVVLGTICLRFGQYLGGVGHLLVTGVLDQHF